MDAPQTTQSEISLKLNSHQISITATQRYVIYRSQSYFY